MAGTVRLRQNPNFMALRQTLQHTANWIAFALTQWFSSIELFLRPRVCDFYWIVEILPCSY